MQRENPKNTHVKKSAARLYAVQALFQMEVSQSSVGEITEEFETHRIGAKIGDHVYNTADLKMFRDILLKAVKDQSTIDKLTDKSDLLRVDSRNPSCFPRSNNVQALGLQA